GDGHHQHGENCDGISSQGEIEVEIRVGKQIIDDQNADQGGKNAVEIPLCHSCDEKYRQDKEHGDKVILRVKPLEGKAKPGYTQKNSQRNQGITRRKSNGMIEFSSQFRPHCEILQRNSEKAYFYNHGYYYSMISSVGKVVFLCLPWKSYH